MSPVPWPQVKDAFARILDAAPNERDALLSEFAKTPGLRTEVVSLLTAHDCTTPSLTNTARASAEAGAAAVPEISPGTMIGTYRIVQLINSGGMGSVFEALDTKLNRLVALKVLHSPLISPSMRKRFDDESRLLARLLHPAIAQIYEAGTHEHAGSTTPYIAMELVQNARPIDQWVREERPSRAQLLKIFAGLCEAIQHGHQRSIVHRDIKPANILIDGSGMLKVIDFGVAQALKGPDAPEGGTGKGLLIGTLRYMSPEACLGDPLDVDVRSDVYSLGVVLYELLSGSAAHRVDTTSLLEAVHAIREEAPLPISRHDSTLRGDLEAIVHMALRKEREQRYQSAADLAADIQHFLRAQPVLARRATAVHQLHLFARRNTLAVSAFAFVCIALIVGITGLFIGLSRAQHATAEALIQSQRATRTSEFLINTLRSTNPIQPTKGNSMWDIDIDPMQVPGGWGYAGRPGEILTARDLIVLAADKVQDEFRDDPVLRAEILLLLAGSLRETGLDPRTGLFSKEALELNEAALGPLHRKTIIAHLAYSQEAWINSDLEAFTRHRKIAMESSLQAYGPVDVLTRSCTAAYAAALANSEQGIPEAERLLRIQSREVETAFGADSNAALLERVRLGYVMANSAESVLLLRSVRESLESKGEADSLLWGEATLQIARVYSRSCDSQAAAAEHFLQARDALDRLIYPRNPRSLEIEGSLITCYLRMGRIDLALPLSRGISEVVISRFQPGTTGHFSDKGRHARVLAEAGQDLENAVILAQQAVEGIDTVDATRSADWAIYFTAVRAQALRKLGRPLEAIEILDHRLSRESGRLNPGWAFGFVHNERAESLELMGRRTEAIAASALAVRAALDFTEALDACHPILRAIRATAARLQPSGGAGVP